MARTKLFAATFESGSLIEVGSSLSTSIVTSPAPPHSFATYSCKIAQGSGFDPGYIDMGAAGTDWVTVGFYWRVSNAGTKDFDIFNCGTHLRFIYDVSTGDIIIKDSTGATLDTISSVISEDVWYRMQIKFKVYGGAGGSNMIFKIDNTEHFNGSGLDLDNGGGDTMRIEATIVSVSAEADVYVKDVWAISDDGANIDTDDTFHGPWGSKVFQATDQSATADSGDSAQNSTTYADSQENPIDDTDFTTFVVNFADTQDEGIITTDDLGSSTRPGPRNDSDFAGGTSIMATFCWRGKQTSGTGDSNYIGRYGRQVSGSETTDNTTLDGSTIGVNTSTWKNHRVFAATSSEGMPAVDEWFQIGFRANRVSGFSDRHVSISYMAAALICELPSTGRLALIDGKLLTVS